MTDFNLLFNARGIAIIGASEDPSRSGSQPIAALKANGFKGGIYPVNPRYKEVSGYKCYATPADIEGPVDIAVIALPAAGAVDMVETCGKLGIPFGVVLGGGFREVGPQGLALQNRMVDNARRHGMRLIGPNCNGLANIHSRMYACFGSISRPPVLAPGTVSVVMQSGGFGYGMALACRNRGIGFRMLIASGNEADLDAPELIDALVDDPATEIILAYLEGVMNGRALLAAADRALAAGKPLLIWKAGKTRQGLRAAATHTANMTGTYDVWRAAFRQHGIIELTEMEQITDYIRALDAKRLPRGRNIAVITPSGGSAVVASDAADTFNLGLPKPAERCAEVLKEAFGSAHSRDNPIDVGAGGIGPDRRENFGKALRALLAEPDIHQICLMTPTSLGARAMAGAEVAAEVAAETDKPLFVFSALEDDIIAEALAVFARARIPVLPSPVRVARSAGMLADWVEARAAQHARGTPQPVDASRLASLTGTLDEAQSKAVLAGLGLGVTRDLLLPPDQPLPAQLQLGYPLAVKVVSADIAHKSDIGGVILNVRDRAALEEAARAVVANARRALPEARIAGVLVSEMVTDGIEAIVGISQDSVFGPVIMLGMGGVLAEAMRDVSLRIAPIALTQAREMIGELRASSVFDGLRGKPPCDREALAEALVKVSQFAWQERERIAGLDINPLLVRPAGKGVCAADALLVLG